jgi:deoxyribonuclease V
VDSKDNNGANDTAEGDAADARRGPARKRPHPQSSRNWNLTVREAIQLQKQLAGRVRVEPLRGDVRYICGADVSILGTKSQLIAGVVLWDLHDRSVVEQAVVRADTDFPYVPGLLSFREAPAVLAAFQKLHSRPQAAMFDGQGYAHPRRFGLACHLGVLLDIPSIGCAKSRLIGTHREPGKARGRWSDLLDGDEVIGAVLRTRDSVRPLYVSVGHRADLPGSIELVLRCAIRYRLPEPTRLAHQLVTAEKARV